MKNDKFCCPKCKSSDVTKYGVNSAGNQRFLCKGCRRQFVVPSQNRIILNGVLYTSLKEVAEEFDQKPSVVSTRLSRGWSLEESLQIEKRSKQRYKQGVPLSIETPTGVLQFESIKEAALHFGLKPATVRARLKNSRWPAEMALGVIEPEKKKAHNRIPVEVTINGVQYEYESITAAAKAMGLSEFLVFGRINRDGWTIEQALELSPPPEHVKKCYGYIYVVTNTKNGEKYVGQTMRHIEERWEQHVLFAKQKSESNKNSYLFTVSWLKLWAAVNGERVLLRTPWIAGRLTS